MASWSQASSFSQDGRVTIRKVMSAEAADADAVKLTLFGNQQTACGWFIGPLSVSSGQVSIPYLPKSAGTIASVAVVRAVRAAEASGAALCLIDPDDLWGAAWRS